MTLTIKNLFRYAKRLPDRLRFSQPSPTFHRIGSLYGGWWLETHGINSDSFVLCAGVGEDVTFDLGLITKFGCRVLALDPTPKAVEFVHSSVINEKFEFIQQALAKNDGMIELSPPKNPTHASYSLRSNDHNMITHRFPCISLESILNVYNKDHFDLIKMDIEGYEFEVIDSIIEKSIPINQLCIEFHREIAQSLGRNIRRTVNRLHTYGLKLVYKEYDNFTFLRHQ
jgi:FkbM family methyltransferase